MESSKGIGLGGLVAWREMEWRVAGWAGGGIEGWPVGPFTGLYALGHNLGAEVGIHGLPGSRGARTPPVAPPLPPATRWGSSACGRHAGVRGNRVRNREAEQRRLTGA
uniref:Uncharacterized protein n=1 Tax=Setaria viridis TaxID=4556 RepID=A0A4U6VUS5_SETVI|nr:hypothetical protein SEVIR_2G121200v2 [Setaria viridis]